MENILSLVTAPSGEPVSLAEAKLHVKVETAMTADDSLITSLITAARIDTEERTRRALIAQTWDLALPCFPSSGVIRIPKPPLASITSVKYYDLDNTQQTLAVDQYAANVSSLPGRVVRPYLVIWPYTYARENAVVIRFVCGYGNAAAVPDGLKAAMKLLIGGLYAVREPVNIGNIVTELPLAYKHLMGPYMFREF